MSQYLSLKVKEIIRETADAVTIVFQKPSSGFFYKPGQFLTFIVDVKGEKVRRSYSLSSSPFTDPDIAVSVKKVQGGAVSGWLVDQLKAGDVIEAMAPAGIFTYEFNPANKRDIVLIGAGSGITPLFSILKTTLYGEQSSNVYLIYGNRDEDSVILKRNIEALKLNYADRLKLVYVYSQPKTKLESMYGGRLTQGVIRRVLEDFKGLDFTNALFYVCGPQGMMEEAFKVLDSFKVPHDHVRKESFLSASPAETKTTNEKPVAGGPVMVNIKYGKKEYQVAVAPGQTILEAALDNDIDLPYSCQSGMCTACMGKCKSGKVEMDDPDGLSENEIKQGFVLTCVGKPVTEGVYIEIE